MAGKKLELERCYWQSKEMPWQIVTELDIPPVFFQNIIGCTRPK